MYIARKVHNNSFAIAGGKPGLEVSWQISGIRRDAYPKAHPLRVETEKSARERGYFLHPELYGASQERSMERADHPEGGEQMNQD